MNEDFDAPVIPTRHYTDDTIQAVLKKVASGESLSAVLESDPTYPSKTSWFRWVSQDPHLSAAYVHAVQQQVAARFAIK